MFGVKGHSKILRNSEPSSLMLPVSASIVSPGVPASAGFLSVSTWNHCSTVLFSKISATLFATKVGCFLEELSHWTKMVLSVHKKVRVILSVSACLTW